MIFVVDSTDDERLMLARDELRRLLSGASQNNTAASSNGAGSSNSNGEGLGDVPFLLMYNKKDMGPESKSSEELSGRLDIEVLRKD